MTNSEASTAENAAVVAPQGATVAPEKASSKKGATQKQAASKRQKTAKGKPPAATLKKEPKAGKKAADRARAKHAATPRADSKGSRILELIRRPKGATLAEIRTATDWQAHSVRGFISTASKKHNVNIESSKTEVGDRVYQIKK